MIVSFRDEWLRAFFVWRLIFQWDGSRGDAEGVYLDDHSYR